MLHMFLPSLMLPNLQQLLQSRCRKLHPRAVHQVLHRLSVALQPRHTGSVAAASRRDQSLHLKDERERYSDKFFVQIRQQKRIEK